MNYKTTVSVVLLCALISMLWSTAIQAKRPNATKTRTVKVKVKDAGKPSAALEVSTWPTTNGCPSSDNPGKGCIKVDKGDAADLVFRMTGNPECSDDKPWELTGVQLGGFSDTTPAAKPAAWGNIPDEAASDFSADKTSGEARITVLDKNAIRVHNRNEHAYTIWYRLKATCGGADIYYDPKVDNTGR